MTSLSALHRGLDRVRRYRTTARIGSACAWYGSILLWILMGAFVLDVATHMGRLERMIILMIFIGTAVWAYRRYVAPAVATEENEAALALLVERQQGIGSDLIAALQFADTDRNQFGSTDLRGAVVDCTAEVSQNLDYLEGFSRDELRKRAIAFAVTAAVVLITTAAYAGHVGAFLNRFFLGSAHYPTRTIIVSVDSPKHRAAYGQPVQFIVRTKGERPKTGRVELEAISSGLRATVDLKPSADDVSIYVGTLKRAMDDLSYTVHIGDAYTEPASVNLIPLPVIEVKLDIKTPAYAASKFENPTGQRQTVALQGSTVVPIVTSDKSLQSVQFSIDDKPYMMRADGKRFVLDAENNPLAHVQKTFRYQVQVVDADGLSLERPVSGVIQVRPDQPPRVAVATVTRYVIPTAAPRIKFKALDDYGLAKVLVHRTVIRHDENGSADAESKTRPIAQAPGNPEVVADNIRVDLSDLNLTKGDRVAITFEAVDFRGDLPGKSSKSERLVFQVTDRAGVLAALRELDAQMDKKLDQIIRAQLGIGDSP